MKRFGVIVCFLSASTQWSCSKLNEFNQKPELTSLEQGFKASAAIGYCASLASTAFSGGTLPNNVAFNPSNKEGYSGAGLLVVDVDAGNPIPFNKHIGNVVIGALWDGNSGVMSILFSDFDVISSQFKFYGIYTVPIIKDITSDKLIIVFAEQDIIIGEGSETIVNLSLSKPQFNLELDRAQNKPAADPFVAVKQNFWHVAVDQNNTPSNFNDDEYKVSGGGQIIEANSNSGGILYHALIDTKFSPGSCAKNPTSGTAFIQNVKAGSGVDLGNIVIDFHNTCDGRANVIAAFGKYVSSNGKSIALGWD